LRRPPAPEHTTTTSNVYGHGFGRTELAELQALGFELRPEVSTYPGSQVCSFLDFARGPALELIEVTDERRYRDFVPPGMEPYCPGISLVAAGGVPAVLDELEREAQDLEPYRLHVGYHGGTDASSPGWDYLNFGRPVVRGTFVWFTSFDGPRPARERRTTHPNGVVGVTGLAFDLPSSDLARFSELAHGSVVGGALRVAGLDVWTSDAAADLPPGRDQAFPLVAVVLEAPSLDGLARAQHAIEITFRSERAVLVRTNSRSWDLLVRAAPGPAGGVSPRASRR
jgi:hypothetical protein